MKVINNLILSIVISAGFTMCSEVDKLPVITRISFDSLASGSFEKVEMKEIILSARNGDCRILAAGGRIKSTCLFITGGMDHQAEITIKDPEKSVAYLSFNYQRLSSDMPYVFKIQALNKGEWSTIFNSNDEDRAGVFLSSNLIPVPFTGISKIRFLSDTPGNGGILIDDLLFLNDQSMLLDDPISVDINIPVILSQSYNPVEKISINAKGENQPQSVFRIKIKISGINDMHIIDSLSVYYSYGSSDNNSLVLFDKKVVNSEVVILEGNQLLHHGENNLWITPVLSKKADIQETFSINSTEITIGKKSYQLKDSKRKSSIRTGLAIRSHKQDGVHTYRIPGLVTTNDGTLIAVYDNRKNSAVDLQGDIDVGMSRSTDGGHSWEPMKVIMDMGEWGGLPEDENGIGDPSILVDKNNNTIWVSGVWAHSYKGLRNFTSSQPGMTPSQTSQFVLVKSEDDGVTWSQPINITHQIKKEDWYLMLQGPGKGITMKDGTLIFPAQFKDEEEIPHSTIIWSKDHGVTWSVGRGAKSNTTESQVIELKDGSLMLNMRDNRNREDKSDTNGRAIAITKDLGITWEKHHTSNNILEEPVCMGSLIMDEFTIDEKKREIVLFSNPASKFSRKNITVKMSFDDGESWPSKYYTLLDEGIGRGYSCMTKIDDQHIGILYESSRADLVFQIINLEEVISLANSL